MQKKGRGQVEGVTEEREKKAKWRNGREVNKLKEGQKEKKEKEREARRVGTQGGTLDFKWQGWSNGAKNQNPQKSLDQVYITPKKFHPKFLGPKNF